MVPWYQSQKNKKKVKPYIEVKDSESAFTLKQFYFDVFTTELF